MPEQSPILLDMKFESVRNFEVLERNLGGRRVIDVSRGSHPPVFEGVKYALVWKPDPGLFDRLPNLEVLFSVGAGVDHIFRSAKVPDVPIVRFVDETLTTRMSEWVVLQCLAHLRQLRGYLDLQARARWHELPQPQASEVTVGIMGMGVLGQDAARKLKTLGFDVIGWSRTRKTIDGIPCHDSDELDAFLSRTHFLVGLLPLTPETTGIYNRGVFERLKHHDELPSPVFINAGRGKSQVETDVIACLQDGTLGGVSLDVFEEEPLPPSSPLWGFANALLTPHAAAVSDMAAIGRHVSRQIERHEAGEALQFLVDRSRGY